MNYLLRGNKFVISLFLLLTLGVSKGQTIDSETLDKLRKVGGANIESIVKSNLPLTKQQQDLIESEIKTPKNINLNDSKEKELIQESIRAEGSINNEKIEELINEDKIEPADNKEESEKDLTDKKEDIVNTFDESSAYFGYEIFQTDSKILENSLAETLDPNYVIGPGDEIIIMLWGDTELLENYTVTREGYLFIGNIGQVFVNGLTLNKLENKLFKMMKKVHSSLEPSTGKPTTFFDVSLGSSVLKPKRIFVVGEVEKPGAYQMMPSASIFTSLYYFKGPKVTGSLRDIKLIRNGKEIKTIDFYSFLLTGKTTNDSRLSRDDVIFIPSRGKTVTVSGEIGRPGIYELKEKEGLKDLIKIAGDLLKTTYARRIQIDRIVDPSKREEKKMNRILIDLELKKIIKSKKNYALQDGDKISFYKISDDLNNAITLNGAVRRPGTYALGDKLTVSEIIKKADGFLGTTFKKRADISRTNVDGTQTLIDIDLEKAMAKDPEHDILLSSEDEINVYDIENMIYKTNVEILGHVKNPGIKTYKKGMQLYDLLFIGGGFENEVHFKNTYLERGILTRLNESDFGTAIIPFRVDSVLLGKGLANMELKMGDRVTIYSMDDVEGSLARNVSIQGFVKRPGTYPRSDSMRVSDLLFLGGGFDDLNHLAKTFMDRADLVRQSRNKKSSSIITFDINQILNNKNGKDDYYLENGDLIRIYTNTIFDFSNYVIIEGAINSPGKYDLKDNMVVTDLILESGGLNNDVYKFKYEIARLNPDNRDDNKFSQIISGELRNNGDSFTSNKDNINNIALKPYDIVTIRPDPYFRLQSKVSISGFVFYPGEYVLSGPDEKVTDLIQRAGGLRPEAYPISSKMTRNGELINLSFKEIVNNPRSRKNFSLMEGDIIEIGSKPNLIKISGAVNKPGNYQYIRGQRFDDYIKLAGGLSREASRFSSIVVLPNGKTKKMGLISLSPRILDGSEIIVGRKEEVEPFNFTEYVTNLTQIYADISQAYLMILLARQ